MTSRMGQCEVASPHPSFYTLLGHKLRIFTLREAQFVTGGIIVLPATAFRRPGWSGFNKQSDSNHVHRIRQNINTRFILKNVTGFNRSDWL